MTWLNYHHLYYFWTVAREGSIAQASQKLHLSQPTISVQLKTLEESLGETLFERTGRRLVLTEVGRVVFQYAEEIFTLGKELTETVQSQAPGKSVRLRIGVAESVPKLITHRLLEPVLSGESRAHLVVTEDRTERLMVDLAAHQLDLILCDAPMPAGSRVRAFNHALGESPVSFFAPPAMAAKYRAGFPRSLDHAPVLLPSAGSELRRDLDRWFDDQGLNPRVVAEVEDSALLKLLAQRGHGIMVAASILTEDVHALYGLHALGHAEEVRERFFAVTVERRITHPAVRALRDAAASALAPPPVGSAATPRNRRRPTSGPRST